VVISIWLKAEFDVLMKRKPRRGVRPLSAAEIKAAADRAEARSKLTAQYSATKRKTKE
jgi:shikimate kinase